MQELLRLPLAGSPLWWPSCDPQNANSRTLAERAVNNGRLEFEFRDFQIKIHVSIFAIT
jgi:hypothetical protein